MTLIDDPSTRHRTNDYESSVEGAHVASRRAPTQKVRLLQAWARAGEPGLTDGQAAQVAGIGPRSCFWKRAGELRDQGLIRWAPEQGRRKATSNVHTKVSVITELGRRELRSRGISA